MGVRDEEKERGDRKSLVRPAAHTLSTLGSRRLPGSHLHSCKKKSSSAVFVLFPAFSLFQFFCSNSVHHLVCASPLSLSLASLYCCFTFSAASVSIILHFFCCCCCCCCCGYSHITFCCFSLRNSLASSPSLFLYFCSLPLPRVSPSSSAWLSHIPSLLRHTFTPSPSGRPHELNPFWSVRTGTGAQIGGSGRTPPLVSVCICV